MATVTVQIGSVCAGGGHVEVRTLVDGRVVSTEGREVAALLPGRSLVKLAEQAAEKILAETTAPDLATYRTQVQAKSEVIPDAAPAQVEPEAEVKAVK